MVTARSFVRRNLLQECRSMIAVSIVATAITVSTATAASWTQWGGAGQRFKADASGLADYWPEGGPKELWNRELGEGYSAILIEDGRLYTMYRKDDMEKVVAINAADGKTIWEMPYDSKPHADHTMQFGDGPRSTPLISGDRLFTIGIAGRMHCLDKKTGKVHWSAELWGDFKGNFLPHGYSSSPIAYKDTVIVLIGGENQSIAALKQSDGSVVWKKHSFENSYSTPKLINVDGEDQLAIFMAKEIIGIDPNNGDLKWQYEIGNQWKQNICMPILGPDNYLFFSTSEAGARGAKLVRSGDKTELQEVWSTRKIQFYHVTSIQNGDYVYGSTGSGSPSFFSAVNIKTGKIAWRKRGFAKATCIEADGKLIILDEDGQIALATATPEDLIIHSKAKILEAKTWTVPTIAGHHMYIRDKKRIIAFDLGAS